jgi:hypothetical protein
MKTKRSVKTKIAKLIQRFGSRKALADALEIHVTYIYKMEAGKMPGKWLYRNICKIAETIHKTKLELR